MALRAYGLLLDCHFKKILDRKFTLKKIESPNKNRLAKLENDCDETIVCDRLPRDAKVLYLSA